MASKCPVLHETQLSGLSKRLHNVDPDYWSLLDESTVLRMQESAHPEVDEVLAAIATGHPAGRLRKAAKKVMHKRMTTVPLD